MPSRFLTWGMVAIATLALTLSTAPQASASPVTITGTVTGQLPGQAPQPLADVQVEAQDPATSATVATTSTDTAGRYSLALESGAYDLTFTPASSSPFAPTEVTAVNASAATTVDVALLPAPGAASTLTGHVYTADGEPLRNVTIGVTDRESISAGGGTYADGGFTVRTRPGTYYLSANYTDLVIEGDPAYRPVEWNVDDATIDLTTDRQVDLHLPETVNLTVRVVDQQGNPLSGMYVTPPEVKTTVDFGDGEGRISGHERGQSTDQNGLAVFTVFKGSADEAGTVQASSASGYGNTSFDVGAIAGDTTVDVSLVQTQPVRYTVIGHVTTATGDPIPEVTVELRNTNGDPRANGWGFTMRDGSFTALVPPGTYTVTLSRAYDPIDDVVSTWPEEWTFEASELVEVQANRTFEFQLPETAKLTVSLLGANDEPYGGVADLPSFAVDATLASGFTGPLISTPHYGTYEGVPGSRDYTLYDGSTPSGPARVVPPMTSAYATTEFPLPQISGPTQAFGTMLQSDVVWHTVTGTVVSATGEPVNEAHVWLEDSSGTARASASTRVDGRFSILARAGTYRLGASWEFDPVDEPVPGTPGSWRIVGEESFDVPTSRTFDLTLPPIATLTVRVLDSTGTSSPGAKVTLPEYSLEADLGGIAGTMTVDGTGFWGGNTNNDGTSDFIFFDGATPLASVGTVRPRDHVPGYPLPTFTAPAIHGSATLVIQQAPLDSLPPSVTGAAREEPNIFGWYTDAVTVSWSATDGVDGPLPAPADTVLSSDGRDQVATSTPVCDQTGNCTTGRVSGISIDATPPSLVSVGASDPSLLVGESTAITGFCSDGTSGVATAEWFVGTDPGEGEGAAAEVNGGDVSADIRFLTPGVATVGLRVRDAAGNWSAVSTVDVTVSPPDDGDAIDWQVEADAPNGGDGNADGVPDYEQTNVTSLPASGAEPGEDVPYVTVASGTNAGGSATALASVSTLDAASVAAPPDGVSLPAGLVDFVVNDVNPGGDVVVSFFVPSLEGVGGYAKLVDGTWTLLSQDRVTIDADASRVDVRLTDGGEGDADDLVNGVIVDPGGVAVVGDVLSGFRAPVDMGNVLNRVKGGSTVPLTFELFRAGVEVTDTSAITGIRYQRIDCGSLLMQADDVETLSTGATSLRYDSASGEFVQNWKTPKTPGCYRLTLTTPGVVAGSGATLEALFKLT